MLVRITSDLTTEIAGRIREMSQKEGPETLAVDPVLHGADLDALYWDQHAHLKGVIPTQWCVEIGTLRVQVVGVGSTQLPIRGTYMGPPRCDPYTGRSLSADTPLGREIAAFIVQTNAWRTKWNEVHKTVMDYVREFKSLNEAVKQWEGLRLYVPEEALRRMDAKQERKAKDAAQVAITPEQMAQLTALAVAHKMGI